MGREDRGKVWLAVAGVVTSNNGEWLVVKKKYGGLKNKWSFPAGFVEHNETLDEAILREVYEETGITCEIEGMIGLRTGVISNDISDNMVLFSLKAQSEEIVIQEKELYDAAFISPDDLVKDPDSSILLIRFSQMELQNRKMYDDINPGSQFGYTKYKLFL
ncbi:NUDIX hydrolase [Cytobacillus sp. IB215665]|uniref:NUDIX hydrolase n=1 Tax=Cytobacillus sp. IB215665 TaxID=3097357 RepID=UPI002A12A613|nr:NUDIX hydrolase [Cytobacillus sp. IB215665]MDX8365913.1 NUDIX hydrolase [Cytobacillus sp. IB215665]